MVLSGLRLSRQQLKRLEEHRYSSEGKSLLEPLMQPFWCWLVERVPLWVAPNLITIIGLVLNITTTLILTYYCPTATEQVYTHTHTHTHTPITVLLLQSRFTHTHTHTHTHLLLSYCYRAVFVILGTCIAVQMGTNPDWMFFCCFVGVFMFYCAHWQTYVSGTLRFGIIDVTEVQIFIITVYLLSAFGGSALWQCVVPGLNVKLKMIPAFLTFLGAVFSCTNYFRVIFKGGMGKNGSSIAGTSVLSPAYHITVVLLLALLVYKISAEQLFEKHPSLFVLAFGFGSAKLTNRLVVAHMTKSEMQRSDSAFVAPLLLFINQYFNSFVSEHVLLWVVLVLSGCDLVCYCTSVCKQISTHLNIQVFSIQNPKTCRNNHH
ncbi:choline/ethanolamine phosphotransferase 1a [Silurus asotus]|uniref:Choline/ethanolamine phosphotransferase 1a n=1 Tax=Silurus asotus TaxID=30991 RepID=A0AAD5AMS7_SILAS|nr:choline/ethanolamine phosphotransferase 1a [Silurus asotus]